MRRWKLTSSPKARNWDDMIGDVRWRLKLFALGWLLRSEFEFYNGWKTFAFLLNVCAELPAPRAMLDYGSAQFSELIPSVRKACCWSHRLDSSDAIPSPPATNKAKKLGKCPLVQFVLLLFEGGRGFNGMPFSWSFPVDKCSAWVSFSICLYHAIKPECSRHHFTRRSVQNRWDRRNRFLHVFLNPLIVCRNGVRITVNYVGNSPAMQEPC